MTNPHIDQVRQSLLDTLADLRNREQPMDIDRARAVAQVAGVLVESAKVEVDFLRVTGGHDSQFLSGPDGKTPEGESLPGVTSRVHRIKG